MFTSCLYVNVLWLRCVGYCFIATLSGKKESSLCNVKAILLYNVVYVNTSICNEVMVYYNGDERERDTDTTLLCKIAAHLHAKVHQWRTHLLAQLNIQAMVCAVCCE